MNKKFVLFIIINLTTMLTFSGCFESNTNNDNTNNILEESYKEKIIGSWYNVGQIENTSIAIIYEFYSNSSYFTGSIIKNASDYQNKMWGRYEINNNTIFFNSSNVNISGSSLKYHFSEDYNNLVLYFEGDEQYIIFKRYLS